MDGFKDVVVTIILVGLFGFALFAFAMQTQADNEVESPIKNEPLINETYNSLGGNVSSFRNRADTQNEVFEQDNPKAEFGSLVFSSIPGMLKVIRNSVLGIPNLIINLTSKYLFGGNTTLAVITTGLVGILVLILILAAWRVIRLGY